MLFFGIHCLCGSLWAQTTFLPGQVIAVTKAGNNQAAPGYTIYTSNNVNDANAFDSVGSFNNGRDLNGFGYNAKDSLLYGAAYSADTTVISTLLHVNLYRLNAAGVVTNLGKLPTSNQSMTISFLANARAEIPNYTSGVTDSNGTYYYTTVGLTQPGVVKLANAYYAYLLGGVPNLDLNLSEIKVYLCWLNNVQNLNGTNMPVQASGFRFIDFSDSAASAAMQSLVNSLNASFPAELSNLEGGWQDMAIKPDDGLLYSYIAYPAGDTAASDSLAGRPVVFFPDSSNANTLKIIPVGTAINYLPGHALSGLVFDELSQCYGLFNDGTYAGIDMTTGALTNIFTSNLSTAGGLLWGDMAGLAKEGFIPPAASLQVSTLNNAPPVIEQAGGVLQLQAVLLPLNTLQEVTWSIVPGSGNALIDNDGLVTAQAEGTVYAKAVAVSNNLIHDSTAISIQYTGTGISTKTAEGLIRIYPNPAREIIDVEVPAAVVLHGISLFDLYGRRNRTIQTQTTGTGKVRINLNGMMPGTYFLRLERSAGNIYKKVIIR